MTVFVRKGLFSFDTFGFLVSFSFVLLWTPTSCISVSTPKEINAVKGETVTLSCSFSSTVRLTSRVSVDWAFTPQSGGSSQIVFHFSSVAYPPESGQFNGRIQWHGNPARGDATVLLLNATLNDNGTYSCTVRNPPDVHCPPSDTTLTVSPKKEGIRFSDVAMLMLVIVIPSVLVAIGLFVKMLCLCSSSRSKSHLDHHSPIEITDVDKSSYKHVTSKKSEQCCCEMYLQDSKNDLYSYEMDQPETKESQC